MKYVGKKILRWGFTLLEVLIVLVIMAVMAGLALPSYTSSVERMRTTEAVEHLIAVRSAMQRHYMENSSYAGVTLNAFGTNLDYDPNFVTAGNVRSFTYSFWAGPTANTYTLRARRIPDAACGAFAPTYNVLIDQNGVVTRA